jgi:hypothetical protein
LWLLPNTPLILLTMHDEDEPSGERSPCRSSGAVVRVERRIGRVPPADGKLLAVLGRRGFTIEAMHDLHAPDGAVTRHTFVTAEWAHRWPAEEIWVAHLREERASAVA